VTGAAGSATCGLSVIVTGSPPRPVEARSSRAHKSRPSLGRPGSFGPTAGRRRGSRSSRERVLLRLAQGGDRHAEELLIESYEQLVSQVCRGFFLAGGESADLLQAARIGLWRAIHLWDPDRGRGFRPFALVVMRREVMNLVTASRANGQMLLSRACSLEAPMGIDERRHAFSLAEVLPAPARAANDPYELAHTRERLGAIVAALATLSLQEREALRLTLNGLSHAQAGSRIGGDAKTVNNALQRARRKLSAVQ
jgi:RNA polymerase sigma-H factor